MAGKLSTHVLDNYHGRPASGVAVDLWFFASNRWSIIKATVTDQDGRTNGPLLEGDALETGLYRLSFKIGPYFREAGVKLPEPSFLEEVSIEVNLNAGENYHVPLLATPWSYSTYRGS